MMAHQRHLEKTEYRQWVKAGLGLFYLREGLAPFCEDIAKQQHSDILDNIKQAKNLSTVTCGQCSCTTLRPDHAKGGNRSCMLGQRKCNCCNPAGKISCPNKVCGAIYDAIVTSHGFTPPAPCWKNTETEHWCTDPWTIAKCFINAPGYEKKASAADIDCIGLLHLIRNNQYFHDHIHCTVTQTDDVSKVITDRNEIFHSSTMQIEEAGANNYIDDMIAVLQDGKELNKRQDAQAAVKKLLELKKDDFIITTKSEANVVHAAMKSIDDRIKEFEIKSREKLENVPTTEDVENKLREKLANVPTTEDVENLGTRVTILEMDKAVLKEEMKELKRAQSSQRNQYEYIRSKLEYQEILMSLYRKFLLQVSAIPLKPERKHCNFSESYVRPRMTLEKKDGNRRPKETEIQSMSDIFTIARNRVKSIYVLGDAGSGKTTFCVSMVNYWCIAHSGEQSIEDEFDGIKEMKKFEFLFYISLRHSKDVVSIQGMLEKQYKSKILNEILNKESRNIVILLDGLDEWSSKSVTSNQFQTEGLPERDTSKDYTVITTSRPWKVEALGITDKEIEQRLKLQGFDRSSVKMMIKKTVRVLNETFAENKSCSDCEDKLNNEAIVSMKKVPIMLLQLICLWFDDKLQFSSKCALHSSMLELFFSWNDKKKKEEEEERLFRKMREMSKDFPLIELPQYLMNNKLCKIYKYLIHELSRLAYETLFTKEKESSLTFECSVFEDLEISDEVKTSSLKLGIVSEDRCPSLYASTSDSSLFSFVHKTVQEYLAAVYITIKLKAHIGVSADSENSDFSGHFAPFIKEVFNNCTTLDEVFEQENVFIILCGLEPQVSAPISKYIYDIVSRDKRVQEYRRIMHRSSPISEYIYDITPRNKRFLKYRRTIHGLDGKFLILYIQNVISECIEEAQACQANILCDFYIGDVIVESKTDCDHVFTDINEQYMFLDSVRSFRIDIYQADNLKTVLKSLQKCRRLEAIRIQTEIGFETEIESKCREQNEVDLSEHQQLQYLNYDQHVIITRVNTSNLEIYECISLKSTDCVKVLDNLCTANKLTELILRYDVNSPDKNSSYRVVTDKLTTLLPSLHKLRELTLHEFTFTDNMLKCPSEMNNMKRIHFTFVKMNLTTWRQFVNSITEMPLSVEVKAERMFITRDGEECNPDLGWKIISRHSNGSFNSAQRSANCEEVAAFQYVREQRALLNVEKEDGHRHSMWFSTKK
ncbi:uncharacterized protein LOC123566694 isoform X2 [Mercenaria mercenaria]|nr:uncharacterized protein LOC123566694 isoform X2 [Mercenaria mercenaria]